MVVSDKAAAAALFVVDPIFFLAHQEVLYLSPTVTGHTALESPNSAVQFLFQSHFYPRDNPGSCLYWVDLGNCFLQVDKYWIRLDNRFSLKDNLGSRWCWVDLGNCFSQEGNSDLYLDLIDLNNCYLPMDSSYWDLVGLAFCCNLGIALYRTLALNRLR